MTRQLITRTIRSVVYPTCVSETLPRSFVSWRVSSLRPTAPLSGSRALCTLVFAPYHRITSHVVSRFSQDQISIPRPTTSILAEFCVELDSRSTVGGWSSRAAHVFASPRDETRGQPRLQSDFSLSLSLSSFLLYFLHPLLSCLLLSHPLSLDVG